ncbi:hypothetical protein VPH35_102808 [Triticum aestivum]
MLTCHCTAAATCCSLFLAHVSATQKWVAAVHLLLQQQDDSFRTHLTLMEAVLSLASSSIPERDASTTASSSRSLPHPCVCLFRCGKLHQLVRITYQGTAITC